MAYLKVLIQHQSSDLRTFSVLQSHSLVALGDIRWWNNHGQGEWAIPNQLFCQYYFLLQIYFL